MRWLILFVLFFARTNMAFQYQSVAALSPFIIEGYAATLADIGLLIGLYLGPGVVFAIPGGTLAARFGDRRVIGWSLAAMLTGGLMMAFGESWGVLMAGRVVAGVGGVMVNVVMTKMVVDWFAGREIGTAMGIFISSWPIGIAGALLVLPVITAASSLYVGWISVVLSITVSLALFLAIYRPAPGTEGVALPKLTRTFAYTPLLLAGGIWALYNTALAMVFGFGPLLLTERGMEATSASSIISLFTLMVGIGIPLGGVLSDRLGRDPVILVSLAGSLVALPALLILPQPLLSASYGTAGLLMGLAAGPIMTMPSIVLRPEARAFGMGVFFAIYYAVMMGGPTIGGGIAEMTGQAATAFFLGSAMLTVCILALWAFRRGSPVT